MPIPVPGHHPGADRGGPVDLAGARILVVRADSPARDIAGFHALAREQGARLNYGSAGIGTPASFMACISACCSAASNWVVYSYCSK